MYGLVSFDAAISASGRDGQWQCVGLPFSGVHEGRLLLDTIGFNADTSKMELDGQGQRATPLRAV
eukprot:1553936-Karenia_brevis.AAC.1